MSIETSSECDEKDIGRSVERFKVAVDAADVETIETVDRIHLAIEAFLLACGYKPRKYDEQATAYYVSNEPPRKEPIVLARWRNGFLTKNLLTTGEVERTGGDAAFIKFGTPIDPDAIRTGDISGLTVVVRGSEDAKAVVEAALSKLVGYEVSLDEFEDERQQSHGPNTKTYSFAGRVSEEFGGPGRT